MLTSILHAPFELDDNWLPSKGKKKRLGVYKARFCGLWYGGKTSVRMNAVWNDWLGGNW